MTASTRLALPFLEPGQAQKELWHNEALQMIDVLVAGAVEEPPRVAPPGSPVAGACYIVAASPTGVWVGHAGHIAAYTAGGWRYVLPVEGMRVLVRSTAVTAAYRAGAWELGIVRAANVTVNALQVVGARGAAIADPAGGATIDANARAAIVAILGALRTHGLIAP